jgi:glucokinase
MKSVCIGIDLGGTFIKFCMLDQASRAGGVLQLPTPVDADGIVATMAAGAKQAIAATSLSREQVRGVGVGSPGPLDLDAGMVIDSPNIPGLRNFPLRDRVAEAIGLPVTLENDANAAAYGEFVCGAGRGTRDMVMLTLGTGVGGGIIHQGRIVHGAHGIGGELGHMIVQSIDGRPCGCGQRGCLEQYASAGSLARHAADRLRRETPAGVLRTAFEAGERIEAHDIHAAHIAGDAFATELWEELAYYLATGCISICRAFDPERIVLAGGMTRAGDDLLNPVRRHFEALHWRLTPIRTALAVASLGNDAGAVGAAGVAWRTARNENHP